MIFEHKRPYNFYRTLTKAVWKTFWLVFGINKMKDNKRVKVLLNFIQIIYDKNPEIQQVVGTLMIEVCIEEDESPEQVFFFAFSLLLSLS